MWRTSAFDVVEPKIFHRFYSALSDSYNWALEHQFLAKKQGGECKGVYVGKEWRKMCTTLTARNSVRLCGTHQIYIYRRALKSATGADNGSRKSHGSGTTGNIPRALGGIISLRLPRIYVQHVILNLSLLHTLLKFLSNPLASPEIGIGAFGYIHNI